MLAAATGIAWLMAPALGRDLSLRLAHFLAAAHELDPSAPVALLAAIGRDFGTVLLMPTIILVLAALAAGLVQHGLLIAPERIQPDWSRLSPLAGLKRLFALRAVLDLGKGVLKLLLIGALVWMVAEPAWRTIEVGPDRPLELSVEELVLLVVQLLGAVTAALAFIAGGDFLYQRFEHARKLRMSRQEVHDEHKQTEGDPHVRARLRAIRIERARRRMMQAVPEAAVVITNPTHFAVALAYDAPKMAAPKVVAKGADLVAQRIRAVAEEHGVPIVENPPLARALFGAVELGDQIPAEHYQAVAQIIAYVFKLKSRPAAAR